MPYCKCKEVKIYYKDLGSGDPLVLIMGFGRQLNAWTFQLNYFKDKMRTIAFDNRGTGKSSRPNHPYSMEDFVNDLQCLIKDLDIKNNLHLCGISMGGMIAQNFILKNPKKVKSLTLISTSAKINSKPLLEHIKRIENLDLNEQVKMTISYLYSESFQKRILKNKKWFNRFKKGRLINPTRIQDYENQAKAINEHNTISRLSEILTPTLILAGKEDNVIPFDHSLTLNEKIPNSKLKIFKNAGHGLIVEKPMQANREIWNFIRKVDS